MKEQGTVATVMGFDLSTTALSCGVRDGNGQEDSVSISMRGKTEWMGQPAHDLAFVPGMIFELLEALRGKGWSFDKKGAVSFCVRQHDMDLLDDRGMPLMPALSWQCNAATAEAEVLNAISEVVGVVGRVEPRFILPKLLWAMQRDRNISDQVYTVTTTGDYIATCLTGKSWLSTSDAMSNGLLDQGSKKLARKAIAIAARCFDGKTGYDGALADLFPKPIQSGKVVGKVDPENTPSDEWRAIATFLKGWKVVSCLGDNHAGGVGCGLADDKTIVISAGTSGTVIRRCAPGQKLTGGAACFEYYDNRLLLMMLADCAAWYNKFVRWYDGPNPCMPAFDALAVNVPPEELEFWQSEERNALLKKRCTHRPELVANAQFSIALELLAHVRNMLDEVKGRPAKVNKFVLTGGMSRSPFFREVMAAGITLMAGPKAKVFVSNREGPLANQAATVGAMINAMVGAGQCEDLSTAIAEMCPLKSLEVEQQRLEALCRAVSPYIPVE